MSDDKHQREPAKKPTRGWDYSSDPLKDGGMQILAVTVGFVVSILLLGLLALAWMFLFQPPGSPAAQ